MGHTKGDPSGHTKGDSKGHTKGHPKAHTKGDPKRHTKGDPKRHCRRRFKGAYKGGSKGAYKAGSKGAYKRESKGAHAGGGITCPIDARWQLVQQAPQLHCFLACWSCWHWWKLVEPPCSVCLAPRAGTSKLAQKVCMRPATGNTLTHTALPKVLTTSIMSNCPAWLVKALR